MSNPEQLLALSIPKQHEVPLSGVSHLAAYIEGCQPEVIAIHGYRSQRGETPENIVPGGWSAAWRDLNNWNLNHNQPPFEAQRVRMLNHASRIALDNVVVPALVIPEHFYELPGSEWQYIRGYFLPRQHVVAA